MTSSINTTEANALLRRRLLDLARRQDDLAATEAATTPYWRPQPESVTGRRAAADVLRVEADLVMAGAS